MNTYGDSNDESGNFYQPGQLSTPMRLNLRRRRSDVLTHEVMRRLERYIDRDAISAAHSQLRELFEEQGVDILTDYDRKEYGLPPRGPDGWTLDEIVALERRRLELMCAPMPPVILRTVSAQQQPISTETNVNEQRTYGDGETNKKG